MCVCVFVFCFLKIIIHIIYDIYMIYICVCVFVCRTKPAKVEKNERAGNRNATLVVESPLVLVSDALSTGTSQPTGYVGQSRFLPGFEFRRLAKWWN